MKKFLKKCLFSFLYFCAITFLAFILKWPQEFDSHVYVDNDFKFSSYCLLILYRFLIYFSFPLIVSFFERIFKKHKFKESLVFNFNVQFCTYALLSGIYVVFGFDKLLGVEIFGSADAMLFITGFIFTSILGKTIPSLIDKDKIS